MKFVILKLLSHESPVQNGMAVTPADMEYMSLQGRSIAAHQLDPYCYSNGYDSPSDLPLPERRGVSMNDNWEMMQRFKNKVKTARQSMAREKAEKAFNDQQKGDVHV